MGERALVAQHRLPPSRVSRTPSAGLVVIGGLGGHACSLSSGSGRRVEVALEGVEPPGPQPPVGGEPRIDLRQRLGAHLVDAPLRVLAHGDEAALAQHAQVLRHAGLAHAERRDEVADGARALQEEVQDAPARGLGEDLEGRGGHGCQHNHYRYIACQGIYRERSTDAPFPSRSRETRDRSPDHAEEVPARARRTLPPTGRGPVDARRPARPTTSFRPARPTASAGQLSERIPRMARHHRAVAELPATLAGRIGLHDEDAPRRRPRRRAARRRQGPRPRRDPRQARQAQRGRARAHAPPRDRRLADPPRERRARPDRRLVRSSHERWDGTGYPDGLSGDAIPLGARIITICDAYDAMTHDRPVPAGALGGRGARGAAPGRRRALRPDPGRRLRLGRRAVALPGDARDPVGRPRRPGRPEARVHRVQAPADPRDGRRHVEVAAADRARHAPAGEVGRQPVTTAIRLSRLRTT